MEQPGPRHVVVVGGGITGLAAAHALGRGGCRVTVLESAAHLGGKLRVSEVAGVPVDEGAESLLLRRPEAVDLARAAGLGDDLEDAATTTAAIWSRGTMRSLPAATVMGVPTDLRSLAGSRLLKARETARVPFDEVLPRTHIGDDVSVGRYVAARMGRAVVERLVEPLLGGVYAGRADRLSLEATIPQLAPYARRHRSLLAAARESRAASDTASAGGAVFGAPRGGVGRLPGAVARLSGAELRTGATVRELERLPEGWRVVAGSTRDPEAIEADGVVVAVPAAATAKLLRPHAPVAAAELTQLRYSSMAVIALAFPVTAFPRPPDGSGFLVPAADGRSVKAVTFSSTKWGWYGEQAPGLVLVRASVGRLGEEAVLQRDDPDLVELVLADLTDALGVTDPPLDARVTRWGGGLPQYEVGHKGRVERVRAAVATLPAVAVAGAAYDGVGIPACVASGQRAAADLLRQWEP